MSKLAYHVAHYGSGAVGALGKHNWQKRGEKDEHSNQDIDPQRSKDNILLLTPKQGLYRAAKERIDDACTGRITKASNWISETIVYPPDDVIARNDKEEIKKYFEDVLLWHQQEFGKDNVLASVVHLDETTPHLHTDLVPLTNDRRLTAKQVFARKNLNRHHTELAEFLQKKGWNIQRGESTKNKQIRALSVPEYKKQAETEKQKLLNEIEVIREDLNAIQTPEEVRSIEAKAKPTLIGKKIKVPQEEWELATKWINAAALAIEFGDQKQEENKLLREDLERAESEANEAAAKYRQQEYEKNIIMAELKREISQLQSDLRKAEKQNKELKEQLQKMNDIVQGEAGLTSKLIKLLPAALSEKAAVALFNRATGLDLENHEQMVTYRRKAENRLKQELILSEQLLDAKNYLKKQEKILG